MRPRVEGNKVANLKSLASPASPQIKGSRFDSRWADACVGWVQPSKHVCRGGRAESDVPQAPGTLRHRLQAPPWVSGTVIPPGSSFGLVWRRRVEL